MTSSGSSIAPTPSTSVGTGSAIPLAECNNISGGGVSGQISTYYSPTTGQIVPSYMAVNVTGVSSSLFVSSTAQIKFIGWYEKVGGSKVYNATGYSFYFMDKLNGATAPSQPINVLTRASLQQAMTQLNLSALGITIDQFFSRMMIVLIGVDMNWEAMTVAYYDTSVSTTAPSSGSLLLPPFDVNPATFKQYYPISDLYSLHPFMSNVSLGLTDASYTAAANQICAQMATAGGRIPASVDDGDGASADRSGLSSSDLQRLKDTRFSPVGKAESGDSRGGHHDTNLIYQIWHRVVESIDLMNNLI